MFIDSMRYSHENYTLYIHHHILPFLAAKRSDGELKTGCSTIELDSTLYDYEGELDEQGGITGHGIAYLDGEKAYEGTFVDGKPEGVLI